MPAFCAEANPPPPGNSAREPVRVPPGTVRPVRRHFLGGGGAEPNFLPRARTVWPAEGARISKSVVEATREEVAAFETAALAGATQGIQVAQGLGGSPIKRQPLPSLGSRAGGPLEFRMGRNAPHRGVSLAYPLIDELTGFTGLFFVRSSPSRPLAFSRGMNANMQRNIFVMLCC